MTQDHFAQLHERAMTVPAPWSKEDFQSLLAQSGTFCVTSSLAKVAAECASEQTLRSQDAASKAVEDLVAFAVGRVTLDEAELLTLVVDPIFQRQGFGRTCLSRFEARAAADGATVLHLEVAENNRAARELYVSAGWRETGRRKSYYRAADARIDAILMTKRLCAQ